jgi:transcriptional regulator with XRE-family HTH domain
MSSGKLQAFSDAQAIGRRVREIRGFDLNQRSLAKLLGVTQQAVSQMERGDTLPSIEMLLKLKEYSGKSIDWLLTGTLPSTNDNT